MSHYNMHVGYSTSNSRGGQPDAPATTRAFPQPLPLPPPPPIRAPPPPASRPVIPPMPAPSQPIMPPMTRQEYQRAQYAPAQAPIPNAGPYTYAPVQPRQAQAAAPVQLGRPPNPPAPAPANASYLTYAPIPPRNAVPLTQAGLVAYDCPHQDCVRRIWVTSVTEHMWNAHGVRM